eukprot:1715145-Rhodomonas_salina.1
MGGAEGGRARSAQGMTRVRAAHDGISVMHGVRAQLLQTVPRTGEGGAMGHQFQLPGMYDRVAEVAGGQESGDGVRDGAVAVYTAVAGSIAETEHLAQIPQAHGRVPGMVSEQGKH